MKGNTKRLRLWNDEEGGGGEGGGSGKRSTFFRLQVYKRIGIL